MTIIILPRLLRPCRIYLSEIEDGEYLPEIAFDCQAEDMLHGFEQARDAYPTARLNWLDSHWLPVPEQCESAVTAAKETA